MNSTIHSKNRDTEEDNTQDITLSDAAPGQDLGEGAIGELDQENRWLAVGPVSNGPKGLKFRIGKKLLKDGLALALVECIWAVDKGTSPVHAVL